MSSSFPLGLGSCAIATLCYGTMFVPIKSHDTRDGLFVQMMMGVGILLVGIVVNIIEESPPFHPLAMLGGVLWATGNVTAVPIVNSIGMTLGVLVWNMTNCVTGWASGRFGWFGIKPEVPASDALNYGGLLLAIVSALLFVGVKQNERQADTIEAADESANDPLVEEESPSNASISSRFVKLIDPTPSRLFGFGASSLAGVFYGLTFAPVIYIQDNYEGVSQRGLPYVFAHFTGVFLATSLYFVVYCVYKQNRPYINSRTALPAFAAGILWAIATAAWFVANECLSEAVSFPIITRMPGIVCALWGVLYFKEITGTRNVTLLGVAIALTTVGGVLSGLSKIL